MIGYWIECLRNNLFKLCSDCVAFFDQLVANAPPTFPVPMMAICMIILLVIIQLTYYAIRIATFVTNVYQNLKQIYQYENTPHFLRCNVYPRLLLGV